MREKLSSLKCHLSRRKKEICEMLGAMVVDGPDVSGATPALLQKERENHLLELPRRGLPL